MVSLAEIPAILASNPNVIALIEYGSDNSAENYSTGDYDVFVIVSDDIYGVESLHFYVNDVPVDLNIRTMAWLRTADKLSGFDAAILGGRVIYDITGQVASEINRLRGCTSSLVLSEQDIAFTRHGHKHALDKLRGRLDSMPVYCRHMLACNMHWLVQNYFRVRGLPFTGEKHAIRYLEDHEPDIYGKVQAFYSQNDLLKQVDITCDLTELILQPIGGMWRNDEVLSFGDIDNLQACGRSDLIGLFGKEI